MTTMKHITFIKKMTYVYDVFLKDEMMIGQIRQRTIGKYRQWCFYPVPFKELGELWFTNARLKEISDALSALFKGEKIDTNTDKSESFIYGEELKI